MCAPAVSRGCKMSHLRTLIRAAKVELTNTGTFGRVVACAMMILGMSVVYSTLFGCRGYMARYYSAMSSSPNMAMDKHLSILWSTGSTCKGF